MKLHNGYGVTSLNTETFNGRKRTIFVYFANRHLEARRFPGQIEISYHNQFGAFEWALYFKTRYPFISLFTMKQMKESLEVTPYSKEPIPELDLDKEYERQYWQDVEREYWQDNDRWDKEMESLSEQNKCETCERLQSCDDDICPQEGLNNHYNRYIRIDMEEKLECIPTSILRLRRLLRKQ